MKRILLLLAVLVACTPQDKKSITSDSAQSFLDEYTKEWKRLYYESSKAEWASNTMIVEGDTTNSYRTKMANEALASFTGSETNINAAKDFLENKEGLSGLQIRQLERILYGAASNPEVASDIVKKKISAETEQTEKLYGYDFKIDGASVSTNDIDDILRNDSDLNKRLAAWESSKDVGKNLKDGLAELRDLRNQTVQALNFNDYYTYQVSDYGMTVDEMTTLCDQLISDVWPLYRELHTYLRYELAVKYGEEVPGLLPAHWLPNRWGQDWSSQVEVQGIDLNGVLEEKGSEWLVRQSERFYVSMGFEELPQSFYDLSSLYPHPDSVDYKKNNHASAWHLDLERDIRSLMSVVPNSDWYETTHHELGHIYYFLEYTSPNVPPLLREGANRAFHEAVGSQMGLASMQKPFLVGLGLIDENVKTDEVRTLLKEALNYVVFIPWSAGVMTQFEKSLYVENLPKDQYNKKWWELKGKYQGIIPPGERGEEFCDAASKTHINNDAAQYYDYALSFAILFQLHEHIAMNILKQDPRATNYFGSKEAGQFLKGILSKGATEDWRVLMKEATGQDINAIAMLNYFDPLMDYLKEENKGREHALPESI
ncbi:MAG: M2 family metallopeptidase [Cyclobacteriaceae bacterium]